MSKMPISWHKQCLSNLIDNLDRERKELVSHQTRVERMSKAATKYVAQIARAERESKDGFDAEKYGSGLAE